MQNKHACSKYIGLSARHFVLQIRVAHVVYGYCHIPRLTLQARNHVFFIAGSDFNQGGDMAQNTINREKRLAENAKLRKLVDAIQTFIAARDAIWSLGFYDQIFRTKKYTKVYADYEVAADDISTFIRSMAKTNNADASEPVISSEEFDALMRLVDSSNDDDKSKGAWGKKRKVESTPNSVGPAFSPMVPPTSSIVPLTPSGANSIPDQSTLAGVSDKSDNN